MFQDVQEILLLGKLLRFAGQQETRDVTVKLSYILMCVYSGNAPKVRGAAAFYSALHLQNCRS